MQIIKDIDKEERDLYRNMYKEFEEWLNENNYTYEKFLNKYRKKSLGLFYFHDLENDTIVVYIGASPQKMAVGPLGVFRVRSMKPNLIMAYITALVAFDVLYTEKLNPLRREFHGPDYNLEQEIINMLELEKKNAFIM